MAEGYSYVAPFWSNEFFAYIPCTPADDGIAYADLLPRQFELLGEALHAGSFSETGLVYGAIATGN